MPQYCMSPPIIIVFYSLIASITILQTSMNAPLVNVSTEQPAMMKSMATCVYVFLATMALTAKLVSLHDVNYFCPYSV